jgi:hypothetical protein
LLTPHNAADFTEKLIEQQQQEARSVSKKATLTYDALIAKVKAEFAPMIAIRDKLHAEKLAKIKARLEVLRKFVNEDIKEDSEQNYNHITRDLKPNDYRFYEYKRNLSKSLPPSNATIKEEYVSCGNEWCCSKGNLTDTNVPKEDRFHNIGRHGPYYYAYWKDPTTKKLKKKYIGSSIEDFESRLLAKANNEKKQEYKKRQLLEGLARKGESQFPTLTERHRKHAESWLRAAGRDYYSIDHAFKIVKRTIEHELTTYSGYPDESGNHISFGDCSDILDALSSVKQKWKHIDGYEESKIDELQHELQNKKSDI